MDELDQANAARRFVALNGQRISDVACIGTHVGLFRPDELIVVVMHAEAPCAYTFAERLTERLGAEIVREGPARGHIEQQLARASVETCDRTGHISVYRRTTVVPIVDAVEPDVMLALASISTGVVPVVVFHVGWWFVGTAMTRSPYGTRVVGRC